MKSITKRRRKIRSSGRKTQHQHKKQHINRASHTKQNKSRKKIMMGGVVRLFQRFKKKPKWNCLCHDSDAKQPRQLQQLQQPPPLPPLLPPPPQGPPQGPQQRPQQRPRQRPPPPQPRAVQPNLLIRSLSSRNQLDGPSEDGHIGLNTDNLFFVPNGIRLSKLKGHPLPESFYQSDVITHINGNRLDIKVGDTRQTNVQKFKDLTKGPIGDIIQFTVTNGRGGLIPKSRTVDIILGRARNKQGGRKTTYRHKKHLSSRNSKKNNKKRKVMVGGTLPNGWKDMDDSVKMEFINRLNENDPMLGEIDKFERSNFHGNNILVRNLLGDKLYGPPPPPPKLPTQELGPESNPKHLASLPRHQAGTLPPPNLFTPKLRSIYPQSASASLPRHPAGTLPPPSLVYSRTQQSISDDDDNIHVVDVDDDVDDDAGAGAAEINQHPPVKQTRKKSNKRRLICECTKGYG